MPTPDNRLKVLHLITLSVVGGAQDNTFSTLELHDRSHHEVHLACNPDGDWCERAREAADVLHPIPSLTTPPHPLKDLKAFIDILLLINREQFDIVHTHTAKAGFLGRIAAWLCRTRIIVHTYHAFPFHRFQAPWKQMLYRGLEQLARPLTDFFITVSENERIDGARSRVLTDSNSETVHSGINFDQLDQSVSSTDTRQALNIPPHSPIVLMVGRLDHQKAPQLLIQAFSQVVKQHPNALLLLAGDGPLRPLCKEIIRTLGLYRNVRLLGFRSDIPSLLRTANIFALSSLWEGMGRAMTEAMLLGRPVVVPNVNGIPEIVHHNRTGLLYDAGDINQLAGHLTELLSQPAEQERLGSNARALTRHLFDVHLMVRRIESIYQTILASRETRAAATPTVSPSIIPSLTPDPHPTSPTPAPVPANSFTNRPRHNSTPPPPQPR